jgi:hypothetical protein
LLSALLLGSVFGSIATVGAKSPSPPQGSVAADLGEVLELSIQTAGKDGNPAPLRGPDAQAQLVVTAKYAGGDERDVTRLVQYAVEPAGVVQVDATGFVQASGDGTATITASIPAGKKAAVKLTVSDFHNPRPVNFPNQITPIFTKFGCNGGGCHGKASGQNGFKLSLLGFEPTEDFEHLVDESRGRRLAPAAPDTSLLLTKAINAAPHGGGQRLDANSVEYRLLRRWIAQGMPYGSEADPKVVRIKVAPAVKTLLRQGEQQLVVTAFYSDGSMEDVTRATQFDSNSAEMGEVSKTGLVKAGDLTGDLAVMARYQGLVAVFRGTVPMGQKIDRLPPTKNFIDELVFQKLQRLGMPPSSVCDDATFVRRATVDIAGRLPTIEETEQFLADKSPDKRDRLIDALVDGPGYADYFANKWSAVLRNRRKGVTYTRGTYGFHAWIRQSLYENKPYDEFVREILAASGEMGDTPAVAWYREVKSIDQQVENSAQLFLGLRLQCARCHHHPFESWSQRDYYGYSAFFTQLGRKAGSEADEEQVFHKRGIATAANPKTGENLKPTNLGGAPLDLAADDDPRQALVDWMAEPTNPFFAPALVNRYWKHFLGRGIVDPEDDMRVTNPATNPELLDALAKHFIQSKFDMKNLVRTICKSTTYQLSAEPNAYNAKDLQNFSRFYPKRLNAEVLLDGIDYVTGNPTIFKGLPAGSRAVQIPDNGVTSYFLAVFGKPDGESACECERSGDGSLAQALHLLNSPELQTKLASTDGRAASLTKDATTAVQDKIRQVYLAALSRYPQPNELAAAEAHVRRADNDEARKRAYENILWALVNTKEFLFNH